MKVTFLSSGDKNAKKHIYKCLRCLWFKMLSRPPQQITHIATISGLSAAYFNAVTQTYALLCNIFCCESENQTRIKTRWNTSSSSNHWQNLVRCIFSATHTNSSSMEKDFQITACKRHHDCRHVGNPGMNGPFESSAVGITT